MSTTKKYSESWVGKNGQTYRNVYYWVGVGYTAGFLEVQDDLLNWRLA